jgi:hypothetical protein
MRSVRDSHSLRCCVSHCSAWDKALGTSSQVRTRPSLCEHDAAAFEHCDVFHERGQRHFEGRGQRGDRLGPAHQPAHDGAARGVGQCVEDSRQGGQLVSHVDKYRGVLLPAANHPTGGAESLLLGETMPAFLFLEPSTMSDATSTKPELPDHLSVDPRSPHHVAAVFEHDIGIRFNGKERFDVEEYCVSEGWVKVPAGKTVDRKGRPLLIKLKGQVEAFYR